jgi:hypothetical protein
MFKIVLLSALLVLTACSSYSKKTDHCPMENSVTSCSEKETGESNNCSNVCNGSEVDEDLQKELDQKFSPTMERMPERPHMCPHHMRK